MDDIIVGMWRTGCYTQLDPDAIPDTPPAAPDVSTSTLYLARQQVENQLAASEPQDPRHKTRPSRAMARPWRHARATTTN